MIRRAASVLLLVVLVLLGLGAAMLASASTVRSASLYGDPYVFLRRQLVWLVVALCAGLAVHRIPYRAWYRAAPVLGVAALVLLALVFVPGLGRRAGGAFRWVRLGPISFQPSELAKLAIVVGLAAWTSRVGREMVTLRKGMIVPLVPLGIGCLLLLMEPDFGTTLLMGTVGLLMLYVGGARPRYVVVIAVLGFVVFAVFVMHDAERMQRILAFLMPEKYPNDAYHLEQSKIAFIKGHWLGVGFNESIQKHYYLPEAHTDFIFAIFGEELGFWTSAGVVALFAAFVVCGMIVSFRTSDPFGRMLAFGLTLLTGLQAAINIGVVTGCLPTKGLPLPFISYGGTSLVASVASVAIILNIASSSAHYDSDEERKPILANRDRDWRESGVAWSDPAAPRKA